MSTHQEKLLQEIKLALEKGDLPAARQFLIQFTAQHPEDYRGWLMLGGILKPEQGIPYLLKAQLLAPDNTQVLQALQWASERSSRQTADDSGDQPKEPSPDVSNEPADQQNTPVKPKFSWLKTSALVFVLVVLAVLFGIGLTSFLRGTEPTILGHQFIIVTSGSMEPVFNTGSIILINTKNSENFSEGDIIMFRSPENPQTNITHRIIEVVEDETETTYLTKGDNNDYADNLVITDADIVGQYTHITIPRAGYFFSFVKSRNGLILLAMSFGIFLIITQAVRIKELLTATNET